MLTDVAYVVPMNYTFFLFQVLPRTRRKASKVSLSWKFDIRKDVIQNHLTKNSMEKYKWEIKAWTKCDQEVLTF